MNFWLKVIIFGFLAAGGFLWYCIHEAQKMLSNTARLSYDLLMLEKNPDYPVHPYTYIFLKSTTNNADEGNDS